MAITKSFSRRSLKKDVKEAETSHRNSKRVSKVQISAPVELISTTNMISYTSPSLRLSTSVSSVSSSSPTSSSFPPLSASSSISEVESASPPNSPRVRPNHLSTYFNASPSTSPTLSPGGANSTRSVPPLPPTEIPPVPKRSPTTSSQRSSRKSQGPPPSASSNRGNRRTSNPFGAELAKVSEIAEDYGVSFADAEEEYMSTHGLRKFAADDYLEEIGGLFGGVYDDELPNLTTGWIWFRIGYVLGESRLFAWRRAYSGGQVIDEILACQPACCLLLPPQLFCYQLCTLHTCFGHHKPTLHFSRGTVFSLATIHSLYTHIARCLFISFPTSTFSYHDYFIFSCFLAFFIYLLVYFCSLFFFALAALRVLVNNGGVERIFIFFIYLYYIWSILFLWCQSRYCLFLFYESLLIKISLIISFISYILFLDSVNINNVITYNFDTWDFTFTFTRLPNFLYICTLGLSCLLGTTRRGEWAGSVGTRVDWVCTQAGSERRETES